MTPSLLAISSCVIFLLFRYFRITSPTCIHLPPSQPCCFLWIYLIRYVCVSPVSRYEIKVKEINHGSFWVVADQKHLFCIFLKFIPRFLQFYVVVLFELIDHTRDHIRLAGIQVHHVLQRKQHCLNCLLACTFRNFHCCAIKMDDDSSLCVRDWCLHFKFSECHRFFIR